MHTHKRTKYILDLQKYLNSKFYVHHAFLIFIIVNCLLYRMKKLSNTDNTENKETKDDDTHPETDKSKETTLVQVPNGTDHQDIVSV